jgi:hypothetical protein
MSEPVRKTAHARAAASSRRWHWTWRKEHVRKQCRQELNKIASAQEFYEDAGYCIDRYTVDRPEEEPQ